MEQMKVAMKAKDTIALESLRAIKSALLLAQTETGGGAGLSADEELKLIQKLVKQRKDSAAIYSAQGREDLAAPELAQVAVIEKFLPEQMAEEDVAAVISKLIESSGASGMKDMGKIMGLAGAELAGRADTKTIAMWVKKKLS